MGVSEDFIHKIIDSPGSTEVRLGFGTPAMYEVKAETKENLEALPKDCIEAGASRERDEKRLSTVEKYP
jgi:hypothetical protein